MYFFFFKMKTAYEMRISDWSSDVCSSDLSSPTQSWLAASRVASLAIIFMFYLATMIVGQSDVSQRRICRLMASPAKVALTARKAGRRSDIGPIMLQLESSGSLDQGGRRPRSGEPTGK